MTSIRRLLWAFAAALLLAPPALGAPLEQEYRGRVQGSLTDEARRANAWQYGGLKGPNYTNVDFSLSKRIPLKRNVKLNLRLEAYNLLNGMNWANPSIAIGASNFGQVLRQADAYFGRQLQYTLRVEF